MILTGYLSLDTDEIPGNAGMFDQIEGLRWVNKFIKYFGGDPDAVTVVGESAGAASASFLMLAPQARGIQKHIINKLYATFIKNLNVFRTIPLRNLRVWVHVIRMGIGQTS